MDFKQPQFRTVRCIVRPAEISDMPAIVAALESPLFPRRLPLVQMYEERKLRSWLERLIQRSGVGSALLWSIDLQGGSSCIGQITLSLARASRAWRLSFWLHPDHWGEGLIHEAVFAVLPFAFEVLGISRVCAGTAVWNQRSDAAIRRIGFRFVSEDSGGYELNGLPEPVREYELRREEWEALELKRKAK